LVGRNEDFANLVFNKTREEIGAYVTIDPTAAIENISKTLEKKTLALNIYYEDLSYTLIEEVAKQDLIDVLKLFNTIIFLT
jgi:hypothetical protein